MRLLDVGPRKRRLQVFANDLHIRLANSAPQNTGADNSDTNQSRHQRHPLPNDRGPGLCITSLRRWYKQIRESDQADGKWKEQPRKASWSELANQMGSVGPVSPVAIKHVSTPELAKNNEDHPVFAHPAADLRWQEPPKARRLETGTQSGQRRVGVQPRRKVRLLPWKERRMLILVSTSNEMRISCRRSCWRPHQPSFHNTLTKGAARAEFRAHAACRLHARVRHHSDQNLVVLNNPIEESPHGPHDPRPLIEKDVVPAIKLHNTSMRDLASKLLAHQALTT